MHPDASPPGHKPRHCPCPEASPSTSPCYRSTQGTAGGQRGPRSPPREPQPAAGQQRCFLHSSNSRRSWGLRALPAFTSLPSSHSTAEAPAASQPPPSASATQPFRSAALGSLHFVTCTRPPQRSILTLQACFEGRHGQGPATLQPAGREMSCLKSAHTQGCPSHRPLLPPPTPQTAAGVRGAGKPHVNSPSSAPSQSHPARVCLCSSPAEQPRGKQRQVIQHRKVL